MSLFSDNISHLRSKKNISRTIVEQETGISSDNLAKYEQGKSQAPYETLIKLSRYYQVSIDVLLTVDIRKIDMDGLIQLEDNRILLPIAVDFKGDNAIEIIPHKAKAGYAMGYSDPEFIESLQHITLPFLKNGKFRAFPVEGDSMPPHKEGSFVIGRYIERLSDVSDGRTYILLTRDHGIVYKRLNKNGKNSLVLQSDNTFYEPYTVRVSDVLEIWEYACSIATKEFEPDDSPETIRDVLQGMRKELAALRDCNKQ